MPLSKRTFLEKSTVILRAALPLYFGVSRGANLKLMLAFA